MRPRALAGVALAISLALCAAPGSAAVSKGKVPNRQKVKQQPAQNGHAHHLLKAEEQLVAAEAALAAQNAAKSRKHVAAALKQVREAAALHHKHRPSGGKKPSGFGGAFQAARHHNHHATLQRAEAELVAAERALAARNGAQASKDIARAARTIKGAIASHNHLHGKA
jgi:hypothetical protein